MELGLNEAKGVSMPGVSTEGSTDDGEVDARRGRAVAAQARYLGQDRVDSHFALKEASTFTSDP